MTAVIERRGTAIETASPLPAGASAQTRMRALYATHADPLLRFLLRLTDGERYLAEDLLQETMLRAWRAIGDIPADWETERRWLWIVARRVAIDAVRARRARPTMVGALDVAGLPAAADTAGEVVAAHLIRQALPKLSAEHRTVLVDIYFRGLGTAQIAARLGIPEGTVRSRAHYALRTLRRIIGSLDAG